MKLAELQVMQTDLRVGNDLSEMTTYVQDGGFWTSEELSRYQAARRSGHTARLIQISLFEDGSRYVHDGHHRCVATALGGRDYLREDEFELREWRYAKYLQVGPEAFRSEWFTPFDPRLHVRVADFSEYKAEAKRKFEAGEDLVPWIATQTHRFLQQRSDYVKSVVDLAEIFRSRVTLNESSRFR